MPSLEDVYLDDNQAISAVRRATEDIAIQMMDNPLHRASVDGSGGSVDVEGLRRQVAERDEEVEELQRRLTEKDQEIERLREGGAATQVPEGQL